MVGAVIFLLNNDSAGGVYNMCAPNPVTNTEFSKELALACTAHACLGFPH